MLAGEPKTELYRELACVVQTILLAAAARILVRTRVPPLSIVRDIRAQIVQIDPEQQVMRVRDLDAWITGQEEYAQQRLMATLFGVFAVLALALAAVGLYSVVSYGVATRTNEFGIRMALGARAADVFRIVLSSTAMNVGAGVIAGIVLSIAFNKVSTKLVTESSRDPLLPQQHWLAWFPRDVQPLRIPCKRCDTINPKKLLSRGRRRHCSARRRHSELDCAKNRENNDGRSQARRLAWRRTAARFWSRKLAALVYPDYFRIADHSSGTRPVCGALLPRTPEAFRHVGPPIVLRAVDLRKHGA